MGEAPTAPPIAPLLLTAKEAAAALHISPRLLWDLTNRGEIPVVRIGRGVRYDPEDLREWIQRRKQGRDTTPQKPSGPAPAQGEPETEGENARSIIPGGPQGIKLHRAKSEALVPRKTDLPSRNKGRPLPARQVPEHA